MFVVSNRKIFNFGNQYKFIKPRMLNREKFIETISKVSVLISFTSLIIILIFIFNRRESELIEYFTYGSMVFLILIAFQFIAFLLNILIVKKSKISWLGIFFSF